MGPLQFALLSALLMSGCASISAPSPATEPAVAPPAPPSYEVTIRVMQEAADGAPLPAAEVIAVRADQVPTEPARVPAGRMADFGGAVRFLYSEPTDIVVQVLPPSFEGKAWTREGARIHVGDEVTSDGGLIVSEREVFIPLYRTSLRFEGNATLMQGLPDLGPDGSFQARLATAPLAFPDGARRAPYLSRLDAAVVHVRWDEAAGEFAELAAGLAWGATLWAEGEPTQFSPVPGPREATFEGKLPADGRPVDETPLEAAAVTRMPIVGDAGLSFDVTLKFLGQAPPEFPPPPCFGTLLLC